MTSVFRDECELGVEGFDALAAVLHFGGDGVEKRRECDIRQSGRKPS